MDDEEPTYPVILNFKQEQLQQLQHVAGTLGGSVEQVLMLMIGYAGQNFGPFLGFLQGIAAFERARQQQEGEQ